MTPNSASLQPSPKTQQVKVPSNKRLTVFSHRSSPLLPRLLLSHSVFLYTEAWTSLKVCALLLHCRLVPSLKAFLSQSQSSWSLACDEWLQKKHSFEQCGQLKQLALLQLLLPTKP